MARRSNPFPSTLKHGAYSGTTLLPGEDPDDFKKLHDGLIAEFAPVGPLEEDVVATMARLTWRKKNLATYRLAELAKKHYSKIRAEHGRRFEFEMSILGGRDQRSADQIRADAQTAEEEFETRSAAHLHWLKWVRP